METSKELGTQKSEVDILLFAALPTLIFPNDIFLIFLKNILQNVTKRFILVHEILGTDVSKNVA